MIRSTCLRCGSEVLSLGPFEKALGFGVKVTISKTANKLRCPCLALPAKQERLRARSRLLLPACAV